MYTCLVGANPAIVVTPSIMDDVQTVVNMGGCGIGLKATQEYWKVQSGQGWGRGMVHGQGRGEQSITRGMGTVRSAVSSHGQLPIKLCIRTELLEFGL